MFVLFAWGGTKGKKEACTELYQILAQVLSHPAILEKYVFKNFKKTWVFADTNADYVPQPKMAVFTPPHLFSPLKKQQNCFMFNA